MLRLADRNELSQLDVKSITERFGLKKEDIERLTAAAKQAKAVYEASKKKPGAPAPAPPPQVFAPAQETRIGILPIAVAVLGLGILAYAFFRK